MTAPSLSRRGLAGMLGLAVAAPTAAAGPGYHPTALDALAACAGRIWQLEGEFCRLPDDDPRQDALLVRIDDQLATAAMIRPECDKGFAMKAWIVQQYGYTRPGDLVQRYLLADLMVRGGIVAPPPPG